MPRRLVLLIIIPIILISCSKPIVTMPPDQPPNIKNYKHLYIIDSKNLQDSGIYITAGDLYTILVSGMISIPNREITRWPLQARIGKENPYARPRFINYTYTGTAEKSGNLYVGTEVGTNFKGCAGSFNVDVIVWENDDYVQIAEFFEKMKEKNPNSKAIDMAIYDANILKQVQLASQKASEEIKETKKKIRKSRYAAKDAGAFYRHLVDYNRIPPENVILLLNKDANLTKVRSTLGTYLKNKAGKEDMVIIYFAGHGATERDATSPDGDGLEKYLLPYDVDPNDLYATALPMGEISRIFTRIQSERLIFIADSCYSGASGGRTISLTGIRSSISDAFLDRITIGKGKIILTASGANEVSEEDEMLEHGVFTYYLLEGLRGKADIDGDGLITVDEAYRYVSKQVPEATNQTQHPVKKGAVEGQLVLSIVE
jgi:hypothetical protein